MLTSFGLVDAHLQDIYTILQEEANIDEHHDPPLINFEKWDHLKEKAFDALQYQDIPLEYDKDVPNTVLADLKAELQAVSVNDDFSQSLRDESVRLKQTEAKIHNPTQSVGFKVKSTTY